MADEGHRDSTDDGSLTLGGLIAMIARRRLVAGTLSLIALLVGMTWHFSRPVLYEARSMLAIDQGRKAIEFRPEAERSDARWAQLNTQRDMLLSDRVLQAGITQGGMLTTAVYSQAVDPIQVLRERIIVTTSRETWTLRVALRDEDHIRAQRSLEGVIGAFLAEQDDAMRARAREAITFLEQQVGEAGKELERRRQEEGRFAVEHAVVANDPDSTFVTRRLGILNEALAVNARDLATQTALVEQIRLAEAAPDPLTGVLAIESIAGNAMILDQRAKVAAAEADLAMLTQRYLERHPRIIEARELRASRLHALQEAIAAAVGGIRAQQEQLLAARQSLADEIRREQRELASQREALVQLRQLSDQAAAQQQVYAKLVARLSEEQVQSQLDDRKVVMVDAPRGVPVPVGPPPLLRLVLIVLGACVVGAVGVLACELIDSRVHGVKDVTRAAGSRVLATIPRAAKLPPPGSVDPDDAGVVEAVNALRASLRLLPPSEYGRCLAIVSPQNGDGRSTLALRLAASQAAAGERVLLVEADMRFPSLHEFLPVCLDPPGLAHLLAGEADIRMRESGLANLDVIGAGAIPPNPGELLSSHCLPEWLDQCRSRYAWTILDVPATADNADAVLVGTHCDGLLMVVRDGVTQRSAVATCVARIERLRSRLLGVVLNGVAPGGSA